VGNNPKIDKIKIVFLRAYDFPIGGAPQNRLLGIAKGLIQHGHIAEVHQYAPAKMNIPENLIKSQIYKSIPIFNHAWKWSPTRNRFHQSMGIITGISKTIFSIFRSHRKQSIQFISINSENNIYLLVFYLLTKLLGAKLGRDLNEYPLEILQPDRYSRITKTFNLKTNYRWFDYLFFITNELKNFYLPLTKKSSKYIILPVTVDTDRFNKKVDSLRSNNITYCGDLSQSKDGVLSLIESFSQLPDSYNHIKLKLIGQTKDKVHKEKLEKLIKEKKLENRVIRTGFIHSENMPDELYDSCLLVLSRPDNIQARGGFPTKLAEYLATGIPVAVTAVGEIPVYLKNKKNAFISPPDDIDAFKDSLLEVLRNRERALSIGKEGKKLAEVYFSHIAQGKNIADFLISLKN